MKILCLCQEDNHRKMLPAYVRAFRGRGVTFSCVDWSPPFDASLEELLKRSPERPDCILHFDSDFPLLPQGLVESEIPNMRFDVDTYAYTRRRMRWASLFDHVSVCHPRYDETFRQGGHPGAFLLAHAVRRDFFEKPELQREFEIGWVGQVDGAIYGRRQKWLPKLAARFHMNDWKGSYSLEEVAEIYRRSCVVVNIGRDDFPRDANMRVFEALASGALLITSLPSELTDLGFKDGVHFAGYRAENEIPILVARYLKDEPARACIANAGREKCLEEHTYDRRVDQFLDHLREFGNQKLAPARRWSKSRVGLMYVDFFAAHGVPSCAQAQFRRFAGRGFSETMQGATLLAKAWMKELSLRRGNSG
ncbi:MAG: hypothetical protein DMG44_14080 [Acidobacteria bacterium]|nr:MAG: hypothetical protein DMG44_14080 [Acidobacteriota bacterium]